MTLQQIALRLCATWWIGTAGSLPAQQPDHRLTLGHGIDTSEVVVREIVRTVRGYLGLPSPGFTPTRFWREDEQRSGAVYDPASSFTSYDQPATVIQIDRSRARRGADFIDSLSNALAVSAPDSIHHYLAPSTDAMARALGFDWLLVPSGEGTGRGGWGGGHAVYSGDPRLGEEYRHELAHIVASRLGGGYVFLQEGFATWAAGSGNVSFAELLALLTDFQQRNPSYPWPRFRFGRGTEGQRVSYASGALVFDGVFRKHGWPGVRRLLLDTRSEKAMFSALEELLDVTPESFEAWWRREAPLALSAQSRHR